MADKLKKIRRRSDVVIEFIETLIVPSGRGAGHPFKLRPFQKKFIRAIYEPHRFNSEGQWLRVVRRAILSMGRKNGKTALIAALVLVHLVGPEAVSNGELYSAANDREQAGLVYNFARQMVEADPDLWAMIIVVPSTKRMVSRITGSVYRAVSAEAGTKHGFNPTFVVYDELSQAKSRALFDVLDTSFGARLEPLFAIISTQSNDPQHVLSQLIDDGLRANDPSIVCHLYEVPLEREDIFDESCWPLANPALGDFRSIEELRTLAARASRNPSFEATFRNLYLNQRVNSESPFVARSEWKACQVDNTLKDGEEIYLGLDLSATTDLLALVADSATDGDRVKAWFWKPEALLHDHETRDRAPYSQWANEGWINTPPGRAIDYGFVAHFIAELHGVYKIKGLAYDRWRIENLLREFATIGLAAYVEGKDEIENGLRLVPWGQGFRDMAPALDALELSITERKFKHDGNPVLTFCFANAVAVNDPAGNRKFDKSKTRFRIDGAVAAAMAIGLKARDLKKDPGPSVYEERGVLTL